MKYVALQQITAEEWRGGARHDGYVVKQSIGIDSMV